MNLTDSPTCTACNEEEDIQHIFNHCRRSEDARKCLDEEDYRSLLARNKLDELKKIIRFLEMTELHL